ncbi:MAG: tryptophan-rich sensory protein [Alphaproteobacteria bacterium]|nr:tryptophan-rich sensory protein [Alphaproteobacteria bacterium]
MKNISVWKNASHLFFLLLLVFTVGYVGSAFMTPTTWDWYNSLAKSPLNPPDFIFPIVWTILLFLQAIAAFLVWGKASPRWFVAQLMFNMLWSFTFFYLHSPSISFIVSLLFSCALFINTYTFGKVNKIAGLLILPTFLWSLFAIYLNAYLVF